MPKLNIKTKLQQIRHTRFNKLQKTRVALKVKTKGFEKQFGTKNWIKFGKDNKILTHTGLPMEQANEVKKVHKKKNSAAKRFRKARAIEKSSQILEGIKLNKKATFENFSGKKYSGKVVGIDLERGIISLQTGPFFRKTTHKYNITKLKSRLK